MEKIKKVTVRVNGNEEIYYEIKGERFRREWEVLRKVFKNQGELYEQIYSVNRKTAEIAGWHPQDQTFNTDCQGWQKFLEDQGKVHKEVVEEELSVEQFVRDYVGF